MKKLLLSLLLVISIGSLSHLNAQGPQKPSANYSLYAGNPDTDSAILLVQTPKSTRAYLKVSLASIRNFVNVSTYTSGGTYTIPNNVNWVKVNPASTQASLTITMPAAPVDNQRVDISFGGTVTSGAVITSLTMAANTGQALLQSAAPSTGTAGTTISYKYSLSNTKWYRIQ
jgi:hypothetical protein